MSDPSGEPLGKPRTCPRNKEVSRRVSHRQAEVARKPASNLLGQLEPSIVRGRCCLFRTKLLKI